MCNANIDFLFNFLYKYMLVEISESPIIVIYKFCLHLSMDSLTIIITKEDIKEQSLME
jgi:hypothetical protein